jgi:hypothetical protein
MINRTYVAKLSAPVLAAYPDLDIVVATPGSRALPVFDPASFPGVSGTTPPTGWATLCGTGWYYELRGRPVRLEKAFGATGFVPRTNLGFHVSIVALQNGSPTPSDNGNLLPYVGLSASLMPAPVVNTGLLAPYATALADPAYGPVIRIYNSPSFLSSAASMIYLVNFSIAENKDEDFSTLGHA